MNGLCQCGCGATTGVSKVNDARLGVKTGEHYRFVKGHGKRLFRRVIEGYPALWAPDHPRATNRYVFEHVLVIERVLGKPLAEPHVVHHVDQNPTNNRNDNLCVLENQTEHMALHTRLRVLRAGGNAWTQRMCCRCNKPKDFDQFYKPKDRAFSSRCIECSRDRALRRHRGEAA